MQGVGSQAKVGLGLILMPLLLLVLTPSSIPTSAQQRVSALIVNYSSNSRSS